MIVMDVVTQILYIGSDYSGDHPDYSGYPDHPDYSGYPDHPDHPDHPDYSDYDDDAVHIGLLLTISGGGDVFISEFSGDYDYDYDMHPHGDYPPNGEGPVGEYAPYGEGPVGEDPYDAQTHYGGYGGYDQYGR